MMQVSPRLRWMILGTGGLAVSLQILFSLVNAVRERRRNKKIMKQFKGPPPHWLLGNVPELIGKPGTGLEKTKEWTKKYGDLYSIWLSFTWSVLRLTGPKTVRPILNTPEPKDPIGYRFIQDWIGDGLLISKGRKWARNRRLLTPAFHFDILRPYVNTFSESTNIMLDKWRTAASETGSAELEMFESISLMTLDSLMKCIFGVFDQDIQTQGRKHPYIQSVYRIAELVIQRFRFFPYHNDLLYYLSPSGYKFRKAVRVAHQFTRNVIDARKKEKAEGIVKKQDPKYFDFLEILLDCKDEDGNGLSYQEICDEVDTFMFEGHDTTASGISWFLYNLATHPEYQQKCREEVNEVLGDRENIEWDDVPKLKYLSQCLKESLRVTPPVPAIGRKTTKSLEIKDGKTVPEGTQLGISIYGTHHNSDIWPEPDVYDPERFNIENSKNRDPHAFIPFSAGPRNCIGQQFANNEMKTCMAQVLRNFELSVEESRPPPLKVPEIVLRAKDGLWLKVTPIRM